MDERRKVAESLLRIKAIQLAPEDPFTWASGLRSPIYCDNRMALSHPAVRTHIRQQLCSIVETLYGKPDMIAGVATGGIAWERGCHGSACRSPVRGEGATGAAVSRGTSAMQQCGGHRRPDQHGQVDPVRGGALRERAGGQGAPIFTYEPTSRPGIRERRLSLAGVERRPSSLRRNSANTDPVEAEALIPGARTCGRSERFTANAPSA